MTLLCSAPRQPAAPRLRDRIGACALVNKSTQRIERTKKNAAEAALKIWRHPSMKESLLAVGSIIRMAQKIQYELRN